MADGGTEGEQGNGRQTRPVAPPQAAPRQAPAGPPPPIYDAPRQEPPAQPPPAYQQSPQQPPAYQQSPQQPPAYQQSAYQQPVYSQPVYQAVPGPKTNGMAIASLVLGIVSWIPFLWIGFIPGLILGFVGKSQIERSGGEQGGGGLAVAGIVLGLIGCAILGLFFLLFLFGALAGA